MNSSEAKNKLYFPSIVGFSLGDLQEMISSIDDFYKEWEIIKNDKTTGQPKTYLDGTIKKRFIRPSLRQLNTLQSRIKSRILEKVQLPENIHGGIKKKSNITNAKAHQGKKYVLATDLQEFYPSVKPLLIKETFIELGFNPQFAFFISRFTTWKGQLPQGAPSSTHIANIVFLKIDFLLIDFCKRHNITYTRYVDDLTFSSQQDFHFLIDEILELIKSSGFRISRRKTKYAKNQTITGIKVFNHKIDVPEKIIQKINAESLLQDNRQKYLTKYRERVLKTNLRKK
ncbi:reverse transcriptase family protein [Chryseobacterium sp. 3008163]|uniref:reverse transcriptase family protein n=1 Tax=Chryseobacterium sp. 3008163 TaxID=2478663 RepID=UPI000F0CF4DB|nr:reverse transcriptase family protein [Chryseobacterium sp. 3008163]AYM99224.1 RNA-directed DNA polymerase [Chryseobacterium sp. 3008163]